MTALKVLPAYFDLFALQLLCLRFIFLILYHFYFFVGYEVSP